MTPRRGGALGMGEASTQEALIAAGCPLGGVRPRTTHRAAQCGPAAAVSFFNGLMRPHSASGE
jgi:hypothetical protein